MIPSRDTLQINFYVNVTEKCNNKPTGTIVCLFISDITLSKLFFFEKGMQLHLQKELDLDHTWWP